jgi:glutathione S-transferase
MLQKKPLRLITIPISHYCEKARWALTRLQIPYLEKPHMPPFHLLATGRVGGKLTPVLIAESGVFTDSTAILQYLNEIAPTNAKLYPGDAKLRQQVEELEDLPLLCHFRKIQRVYVVSAHDKLRFHPSLTEEGYSGLQISLVQ